MDAQALTRYNSDGYFQFYGILARLTGEAVASFAAPVANGWRRVFAPRWCRWCRLYGGRVRVSAGASMGFEKGAW